MTQEERDRLSILLRDAHNALEEAWRLCIYANEPDNTNRLVLADTQVLEVDRALDLYSMRV